MADDIVHFLMPDGTKVSNDRRFDPDVEEDTGYASKGAKELKALVDERNSTRDEAEQIDLSGVKKKSELVALLEADDEAQRAKAMGDTTGTQTPPPGSQPGADDDDE